VNRAELAEKIEQSEAWIERGLRHGVEDHGAALALQRLRIKQRIADRIAREVDAVRAENGWNPTVEECGNTIVEAANVVLESLGGEAPPAPARGRRWAAQGSRRHPSGA